MKSLLNKEILQEVLSLARVVDMTFVWQKCVCESGFNIRFERKSQRGCHFLNKINETWAYTPKPACCFAIPGKNTNLDLIRFFSTFASSSFAYTFTCYIYCLDSLNRDIHSCFRFCVIASKLGRAWDTCERNQIQAGCTSEPGYPMCSFPWLGSSKTQCFHLVQCGGPVGSNIPFIQISDFFLLNLMTNVV